MLYFIVSVLFERCLTVSVCSWRKNSYFCGAWVAPLSRHIGKCFRFLSLRENVEVFKCKRTTNSTHFLFRCWQGCVLHPYIPYLFKCGVLHRLFLYRSFHNLHVDTRNSAPHFLFAHNPPHRSCTAIEFETQNLKFNCYEKNSFFRRTTRRGNLFSVLARQLRTDQFARQKAIDYYGRNSGYAVAAAG